MDEFDDYYETHDVDDLAEWEEEQVFQDMVLDCMEEEEDETIVCDYCGGYYTGHSTYHENQMCCPDW